jgi:hypothetical protein
MGRRRILIVCALTDFLPDVIDDLEAELGDPDSAAEAVRQAAQGYPFLC